MTLTQRTEARRTYEALIGQYRTLETKARTNADWEVAFGLLEQANEYRRQLQNVLITLTGTVSGDLCEKVTKEASMVEYKDKCGAHQTIVECRVGTVLTQRVETQPNDAEISLVNRVLSGTATAEDLGFRMTGSCARQDDSSRTTVKISGIVPKDFGGLEQKHDELLWVFAKCGLRLAIELTHPESDVRP